MKSDAPQSLLFRAALLCAGGLLALVRRRSDPAQDIKWSPLARLDDATTEVEPEPSRWLTQLRTASELMDPVRLRAPRSKPGPRRATSFALVALVALSASLTAVAGDEAAGTAEQSTEPAAASTGEAPPAAEADAGAEETIDPIYGEDGSGGEPAAPADVPDPPAPEPAPAAATPPPAAESPAPPAPAATAPQATPDGDIVLPKPAAVEEPAADSTRRAPARTRPHPVTSPAPLVSKHPSPARGLELETEDPAAATVWLDRTLPDPTPPSKRLTKAFGKRLAATAKAHSVDWAVLLGLLRARGELGSEPATPAQLTRLARSLARAREAGPRPLLALSGDADTAETARALAHLHRALGLAALVNGLEWAKARLGERLLSDERISLYPGGVTDIEAGRIDVRVLALIAYLAETYGGVTVTSLDSGHRLYSRPGVISAHKYGLAVDIAAVGDTSILGSQQPGGTTEHAVRSMLLLPAELRPRQVISLLGLGGPSFPMADHGDHIHAGF